MKKNYQDEAWRHASRNSLIQAMFNELIKDQTRSRREIYLLFEKVFGLHENQIRKIITLPTIESTLSVDDLTLFLVILQRIKQVMNERNNDLTN